MDSKHYYFYPIPADVRTGEEEIIRTVPVQIVGARRYMYVSYVATAERNPDEQVHGQDEGERVGLANWLTGLSQRAEQILSVYMSIHVHTYMWASCGTKWSKAVRLWASTGPNSIGVFRIRIICNEMSGVH